MGAPATLQNHMAQTPWPGNADQVIFLLDADRAFERQVLKEWISRHTADTPHITVCIALRDDRKTLAVDELVRALEQQPDASIAPLRLSWLQRERTQKAGPRPIDLLRGGDSRPSRFLAGRVAKRQPERVHFTVGEPGTTAALAERFTAKTGLAEQDNLEDFAVFIARQAAVVLDMAERQLIGGRYKVPRYVHQSIRNNREFKSSLANIARDSGQTRKAVRAEASEYLREMISIPTRFWLDVWAKLCEICLGLGYDKSLQYDAADVERIRDIVRQYPSALLWTHKTYIDGFVVPKILFDNDFPMPHFFGGANLNIPVLGFSFGARGHFYSSQFSG